MSKPVTKKVSISANRNKMLYKNYVSAKIEGNKSGEFDIYFDESNTEIYYIMLKLTSGVFAGQTHIIEFHTKYGSGKKYTYPINSPLLKFITPIWHANISVNGSICLDILKNGDKWVPTYDFIQIIKTIIVLLLTPNPSSPLNAQAGNLYYGCTMEKEKLNNKKLEMADYNKAIDEIYRPYKNVAMDYYSARSKPILEKYATKFPSIKGIEIPKDELDELQEQFDKLFNKKDEAKAVKKTPAKLRWQRHAK